MELLYQSYLYNTYFPLNDQFYEQSDNLIPADIFKQDFKLPLNAYLRFVSGMLMTSTFGNLHDKLEQFLHNRPYITFSSKYKIYHRNRKISPNQFA